MKKKILIGISIVVLIVVGLFLNKDEKINVVNSKDNESKEIIERIIVQINGEVAKPGVYEMDIDDRVNDLVLIAGGFTSKANTNLNLVQKLSDGMVINVLKISNEETQNDLISLNKATISELMKLKGVGESKAQSIIEYREKHGPFTSINDLLKISGITQNLINGFLDSITL